jgi:hypothetical protein
LPQTKSKNENEPKDSNWREEVKIEQKYIERLHKTEPKSVILKIETYVKIKISNTLFESTKPRSTMTCLWSNWHQYNSAILHSSLTHPPPLEVISGRLTMRKREKEGGVQGNIGMPIRFV